SCAGCNVPVRITLVSVRLVRNGPDIIIGHPATRNVAYWQLTPAGVEPGSLAAPLMLSWVRSANPGDLVVDLRMPGPGLATLEVFDVSGRIVLAKQDRFAAGDQRVTLASTG